VIALCSSFVALGLAEIGLRVRAHFANRETLARAMSEPVKLLKNGEAPLGAIIRLSADDRITYELKPGLDRVRFKGQPVSTDARGFRCVPSAATSNQQPATSNQHLTLPSRPA